MSFNTLKNGLEVAVNASVLAGMIGASYIYLYWTPRQQEQDNARKWQLGWQRQYNETAQAHYRMVTRLGDKAAEHKTNDGMSLFVARMFEEKACGVPASVAPANREACESLQEFRRAGRLLLGNLEQGLKTNMPYVRKQGYHEAVNILLPTMALDAANAKAIMKIEEPLENYGEVLATLLAIEDELNLGILRAAPAVGDKLPALVKIVLEQADKFSDSRKAPHAGAEMAAKLKAFVQECTPSKK